MNTYSLVFHIAKAKIDHSLNKKVIDIIRETETLPDKFLEENKEIVLSYMDDKSFCSSHLYFVPHKNMGFSVYQEGNCEYHKEIGFLYPQHVLALKEACEQMITQLDQWVEEI